ncbi:MAG TPA: OB-fold nucleic acid binding domain-containing protein, partial [Bacteroidales bacterium]|nr:OB-fold nucleic acid binding domain-containing protein [Bacteroidales bacterium]
MLSHILDQDIKYLKGVGPKRAALLAGELNIFTFKDLLYHFPYKYIDRSKIFRINEINTTQTFIQIRGKITSFRTEGHPRKKRLVAVFTDGSESIELVWFQGINWVMKSYQTDREYIVFGRPALFNSRISIAHPEIESAEKPEEGMDSSFSPQYRTTEKLKSQYISSKTIQKLVATLLSSVNDKIEESLPDYLVKKLNLLSLSEALMNIHFPKNNVILGKATYRLKFEELFLIQLNIL